MIWSPGLIPSEQQSVIASVAFELERVPDLVTVVPAVTSWICAVAGSTVPSAPSSLIVPAATRPPVVALVVNPSEYLTCWIPPALDDNDTAVGLVICSGAVSE